MIHQKYLRPLKRVYYEHIYGQIEDRTGQIGIRTFSNATIVPRGQIPGIKETCGAHTVIDDVDYCSDIKGAENECGGEKVVYAGYFRHQWGHFLLNSTARLWWLTQDRSRLSEIDKIVFVATEGESACIDGNYREFLELLGVFDKVHVINRPVSFKTIIVPDLAFEHDVFFAKEMLSVFNDVRSAALRTRTGCGKKGGKIFLTRSRLRNARKNEVNIKHIDRLFSKNGYEIVYPERLKLSELIFILEYADDIATVSGSTAHNLIFANEKSGKYIVERCAQNNVFQINIGKLAGQNVVHIDSFLTPTLLIPTGNVFYYYPAEPLLRFINDLGLEPFSAEEIKDMSSARCVYGFLSSYKKQSGYALGLNGDFDELAAIEEAYADTKRVLGRYLRTTPAKYWLKTFFRKLIH